MEIQKKNFDFLANFIVEHKSYTPEEAFCALFLPGQNVAFQRHTEEYPYFITWQPNTKISQNFSRFCINSFKAGSTRRQKECIDGIVGITIEFDFFDFETQYDLFLSAIPEGATCAVCSGNKSIHFHITFYHFVARELYQEIVDLLLKAFPFADYSVIKEANKLVRCPGAISPETNREQTILFVGKKFSAEGLIARLRDYTQGITKIPQEANSLAQQLAKKIKPVQNIVAGKVVSQDIEINNSDRDEIAYKIFSNFFECGYSYSTPLGKITMDSIEKLGGYYSEADHSIYQSAGRRAQEDFDKKLEKLAQTPIQNTSAPTVENSIESPAEKSTAPTVDFSIESPAYFDIKSWIAEKLKTVDIMPIVRRYCTVKNEYQVGDKTMFSCPFGTHTDTTPSANVYTFPDGKQIVKCFGCNQSMDVLAIAREFGGLDFTSACEAVFGEKPPISSKPCKHCGCAITFKDKKPLNLDGTRHACSKAKKQGDQKVKLDNAEQSTKVDIATELDNVSAELAKQEKQATKKKKAVAEKIPAGEFLTLQELPNGDFKVNINTAKLVVFLMNCGFRVIKTLDNQLILARRNEYGILSLIDKTFMDVEVKSYIASLSIDEAKKDFLVTWLDTNKTLDCFRVLKTSASAIIPQKRLLDKEQEVYFYFVNCYLKITSGGCEILSYDKLDCAIFDSQVIPIEIPADYQFVCNDDNYEPGTIEKFVRYVCCDQNGKVNASMKKRLEYCMAKLVHTHQNEANLRLIIFSDHSGEESISKGRSGKSLLVKLLSAFRPELVMIDGKKFDDSDKFAFQSLTPRTNIVCLDDVSRNFDIESLYSAVSDGLTIERKFRDSFRLSPLDTQIVLTANREIVRDVGDSTQARIIQVEFGHFFNKNRTPFKEFGKMLLAKNADNTYKSPDEYFAFLGYMIRLVQRYLADPLTIPEAEFSSACRKEKAVKLLDNRTLANFIEICEQPSPLYKLFGKGLTMATIFESYNDFCNDHWRYSKYKVTNIRIFSQRLRAYFESLPEEYVFLKIDKKTYNITKKPSDDIENE